MVLLRQISINCPDHGSRSFIKTVFRIFLMVLHHSQDVFQITKRLQIIRLRRFCDFVYFYSHVPRGTWLHSRGRKTRDRKFLLKRPSRDVTPPQCHAWIFHGFLLTRPSRDVTASIGLLMSLDVFLLTRPSRDVTCAPSSQIFASTISTHTSLAGRDTLVDTVKLWNW